MSHPDIDIMIVMERRREELAEAAQSRLWKEARLAQADAGQSQPARSSHVKIRWPVLALARSLSFLGGRLLNWSCRLQYRYETLSGELMENRPSPCS